MQLSVLISFFLGAVILILIAYMIKSSERMQRTIDRQNDTIQRLINREPVTYAETGSTPQKPDRTIYAAWGNQMIDLGEDERQ